MFVYFFQVTFCWALFALLYSLLFRHETFFRANRFYLLSSLVAGLALPLANQFFPALNSASEGISTLFPTLTVELQQAENSAVQWTGIGYLWGIYLVGAILAAIRLVWGLLKLGRLIYQNPWERLNGGGLLIRSSKAQFPFSFFYWIFVPHDFEAHDEFQNMLAHERAHAQGWHSLDVLFLELFCVVAWFHPLVHWYRRSLRTVHEYLADANAASYTDRKQYGLLLLQQAQPTLVLPFANHFFQAPLKQRLLMLAKNSSPSGQAWKYCLTLPILIFLWACTQSELAEQLPASKTEQAPLELEKMAEFPGGMEAMMSFLATNITYPKAAKAVGAEGLALLQITIDQNGQISQVEPVPASTDNKIPPGQKTNQRPDMVAEAIRVVKKMPTWKPAYKNGAAVSSKITLPIRFILE